MNIEEKTKHLRNQPEVFNLMVKLAVRYLKALEEGGDDDFLSQFTSPDKMLKVLVDFVKFAENIRLDSIRLELGAAVSEVDEATAFDVNEKALEELKNLSVKYVG